MAHKLLSVNSLQVGRTVDIEDNIIHYAESEGQDCILLLHGLGYSMYSVRELYNEFADAGYHAIALDLPGCGYSTLAPHHRASTDYIAYLLREFLRGRDIQSVHIFGSAEGGVYAMRLAQMYPDMVKSLSLASPGSLTIHYPVFYRALPSAILGEIIMRFLSRRHIEKLLEHAYFDKTSISPAVQRQVYQPFERIQTRLGLVYMLRDYNDAIVFLNIRKLRCPVLLLWGECDQLHPPNMAETYLKRLDGCEYEHLRNTGHLLHEERPREVASRILEFIAANTAAPPGDEGKEP